MHRSQDGGKNFSGNGGQFAFTQGRRAAATATTSGSIRRIRSATSRWTTSAPRSTRRTVSRASASPTARCTTSHVDNRVPYWIYSNRQDDGTMRGPATSSETTGNGCLPENSTMPQGLAGGRGRGGRGRGAACRAPVDPACAGVGRGRTAPATAWEPNIGGCESGFTIPDPSNADIVYGSCYGNKVTRWDARTGTARSIQPWMVTLDAPPNEHEVPLPLDLAAGDRSVRHEERALRLPDDSEDDNGGQSWTEFSPDLSTKDPSRIVSNGGIVGDNLGQYNRRGGVEPRVLEDSARPHLGRHERRQDLEHAATTAPRGTT